MRNIPSVRSAVKPAASGIPILLAAMLAFAPANPSGAGAEDWPCYRADLRGGAITAENLAPPLKLQWRYDPAHPPKPAWPLPAEEMPRSHQDNAYHVTIADGLVFFASSAEDSVYAIDAKKGALSWRYTAGGPVRFAPVIARGRAYFGADDGWVYCLNAKDGALIWRHRPGPTDEKVIGNGRMVSLWPIRTSLLIDENDPSGQPTLYGTAGVFPYEGIFVFALNANDGAPSWVNDQIGARSHDLEFGGVSPNGYLVASNSALYVPSGRAMPAAFDRRTGEFLFYSSPGGKRGGAWALVVDNNLIAGVDASGSPQKSEYDGRTGKRKGEAFGWFPGIDMVIAPKASYLITRAGVQAIDRETYQSATKVRAGLDKQLKNLAAESDELKKELAKAPGEKARIDKRLAEISKLETAAKKQSAPLPNSTIVWKQADEGLQCIIAAGDTLFTGGKGRIVARARDTGRELWRAAIEGIPQSLAAGNGLLVASTDTGAVYCFAKDAPVEPLVIKTHQAPSIKLDPKNKPYAQAAEDILQATKAERGYCLVLDCGEGRLAEELARRAKDLQFIAIEPNAKKRAAARERLLRAGLYGKRIVVEPWELSSLPDYFANLIVSDAAVADDRPNADPAEILRVLRPCGGVACITLPTKGAFKKSNANAIVKWLKAVQAADPDDQSAQDVALHDDRCATLIRGPLAKAGSWQSLYGNFQNTACSEDELVAGPLGILWYGEPGPELTMDRHGRGNGPVSMNGRLFVQGEETIRVYDAYNGAFLWRHDIPGAVRARVDVDGGNLALDANALYVAARDRCLRLDPATGKTVRAFELPIDKAQGPRRWGHVSCAPGALFGVAAMPLSMEYGAAIKDFMRDDQWLDIDKLDPEVVKRWGGEKEVQAFYNRYVKPYPNTEDARRAFLRAGSSWNSVASFPSWGSQSSPKGALTSKMMGGDAIFALNPDTGETLWKHEGRGIPNISVALGADKAAGQLYYLDLPANADDAKKAQAELAQLVKDGPYKEGAEKTLKPNERDIRIVRCLKALTGEIIWEKPLDLTGCGGDKMGLAYANGMLLFFGHFSNHDGGMFRGGDLTWRRVTALAANTGDLLWSRPLNYLRRPLVVGDSIIVEPLACDLYTGEPKMRTHPITGKQVAWEFLRPGHCCSITSAAPNALFFRSYWMAIYEWNTDRGLSLFGGIRPGCWLNIIPANGLALMPEASAGCTCSFPLRCSIAMTRKRVKEPGDWTVFITHGDQTPAQHFAINLGAPGDMRDSDGTLWFGYPRPRTKSNTGYGSYEVKFDLAAEVAEGAPGYYSRAHHGQTVAGSTRPWLFKSGCVGFQKCAVPVGAKAEEGEVEAEAKFTVQLGFIAPAGDKKGQRVFDIKLQDQVVEKDFDITRAAGAPDRALIREYKNIPAKALLNIELIPKKDAPVLNSIKVLREE